MRQRFTIATSTARRFLESLRSGLLAQLLDERDRWALWLPVMFGLGIAVYFALRFEPPLWLGLSGVAVAAALGLVVHRRQ